MNLRPSQEFLHTLTNFLHVLLKPGIVFLCFFLISALYICFRHYGSSFYTTQEIDEEMLQRSYPSKLLHRESHCLYFFGLLLHI